ncbi:MAG: hypothetical protein VYD70_01035 [Planctomycetota bacterium]|nr:hypothetical protein [Planctomycetota bacterium]
MIPIRFTPALFLVAMILTLSASIPTQAQLFDRATVLEGVLLPRRDGGVSDPVTIVIRRGRVTEMSADADVPLLSKKIDAKGLYATAGLLDPSSNLTLGSVSNGNAVHSAWDGFDRYDSESIRAAIASGVTRIQLQPSGPAGIVGRVSSISLSPLERGGHGVLEEEHVALCIDLDQGPSLARIRTFDKVRNAFLAAKRRREGGDDYSTDLEEYLEALAEAAKEKAKEGDEKKEKEKDDDESKKDEKKDDDGPSKPARPGRDPAADVLLQVLEQQLPVRIIARRSEDILNAIELANEFQFPFQLQGADEAYMVLDLLAEVEGLSVLLDMPQRPLIRGTAPRSSSQLIPLLEKSEIPWTVGSGGLSSSLWRAVRTISGQSGTASPLSIVNSGAGGRRGSGWLRRGSADLVLWEGNPATDGAARPNRVIIDGTVVWQRPAGTKEGSF